MRTLWLLRHAKASSADDSSPDQERPLDASESEAARRVGRHLAQRGRPDRVLCSSALRARQTLEGLGEAFEPALEAEVDRGLYLASAGDLFSRLQELPDSVARVLLIGHNPAIAELAVMLARTGPPELRQPMQRSYPAGALAELSLDAPGWSALSRGCELLDFVGRAR